jgi:hypothetical protein
MAKTVDKIAWNSRWEIAAKGLTGGYIAISNEQGVDSNTCTVGHQNLQRELFKFQMQISPSNSLRTWSEATRLASG